MIETLAEVDIHGIAERHLVKYHPSPIAWEDQVVYFLLPDRFSDGQEMCYRDIDGKVVTTGKTPMYRLDDTNEIKTDDEKKAWREAGVKWVGGKIKGITSKIGYLKRLGVTAIWVGPIFKQVAFQETYHGYGIQNYLEVDPCLGTIEDFQEMVNTAHANDIYVILDIILNHTGDIFSYTQDAGRCPEKEGKSTCWTGERYPVAGFNNAFGDPSIPFKSQPQVTWPNDAVWPREFQEPSFYTQKGKMKNGYYCPEYVEADFFDLKDITLGYGDVAHYSTSPALQALTEVYKYWIALTDIDGYRIDTVKHMDKGAVRYFTQMIHEFAQSLGKENFYLIGEIAGSREYAFHILDETGVDAALGIADAQDKLEYLVKGERNPDDYFGLFTNSILVGKESHAWFRDKVVTQIDDHDQIRKGDNKARFAAYLDPEKAKPLALNAIALNVMTLGIPCIYYGTEQGFDGKGHNDSQNDSADRYIREAMFGGEFGAFRSHHRHFFNEDNWIYQEVAKIMDIRKRRLTLTRGRQYLRPISGNGIDFGFPTKYGDKMQSIVPWSRIMVDEEILLALNTNQDQSSHAWVIVDSALHKAGDKFRCTYSSIDKSKIGETITVEERDCKATDGTKCKAVKMTVPACGFVIYEKVLTH